MGRIRTVADPLVKQPPEGAIVLGLGRHIGPGDPHFDAAGQRYHADRALLFHDFADHYDVAVLDWGTLDSEETIREVEEIVIEIARLLIPAIATAIAAWIGRSSTKAGDDPKLLGVAIGLPSGEQISYQLPDGTTADEIVASVERVLHTVAV